MGDGVPQITGPSVRSHLPDHLKGGTSGTPFPEVGGGRALGVPARNAESGAEVEATDPLRDKVSISSEARRLRDRDREREGGAKAEAELDPEDKREVQALEARDAEVRRHEQAHIAASGHLPTSGPSYSYETGPDGRRYAVGGEVDIALGEGRTPEETIRNAEAARRAALAPAEPSGQDRNVASKADAMARSARAQLREEQAQDQAQGSEGTPGAARSVEAAPERPGALGLDITA